MTLAKALQKPEESVRRPQTLDDSVLLGLTSNPLRQVLAEVSSITLVDTLNAIVSQLRQVAFGTNAANWSDIPPATLAELLGHYLVVMSCAATVAVGDLVEHSTVADNTAVTPGSNLSTEPIIGVVLGKPDPLTCLVQLRGIISTSLVGRGRVWLSPAGIFSLAVPTTGYVQNLGLAFGNGKLFLNPSLQRTRRSAP